MTHAYNENVPAIPLPLPSSLFLSPSLSYFFNHFLFFFSCRLVVGVQAERRLLVDDVPSDRTVLVSRFMIRDVRLYSNSVL